MADPKEKSEDEGAIVEKEEMVEFLTSSGKVRRGLAGSLYDQGLNTWELLVDGDEEYFTSFKGVGKKTAGELMLIGGRKKEELSSAPEPARDIKDVLSEVPRVNQGVIDGLMDAGFRDVYRVSAVDPSELREVPGVGPKLSERIVEACREEAEKHPQSVAGVREAMPLPADEEAPGEKGDGFLSKLLGKVKSFFSTEKEEPSTAEAPSEVEEIPVEEGEKELEESSEEKPSEEEPEGPSEDQGEKETEEPEEPSEEKPSEEEPEGPSEDQEEKETEGPEEPSEEKPSEEEPEEAPKEEPKGVWSRIKGLFSGKEEEAASEEKEEPSEEKPSEEEPVTEDKTPTDDQVLSEEKPSEKEPSEEEPSEDKPEKEEPRLEIKDIPHIPGVDRKTADLLLSSGYMNLDELKEAVPEDLMMIEGIDEDTAKFIYEVLRK